MKAALGIRLALLALLLTAVPGLLPGQKNAVADILKKTDVLAQPLVDAEVTVGLVVGVLKDGKTGVRGYGKVSKESDATPDGDTVYEIGSITKVFTGLLLADAVERGLVALDDPVGKHLPKEVEMPVYEKKAITLRHLATHSSALPRMPTNFHPADIDNPFAEYSAALLYQNLPELELVRAPGSSYAYSNLGVGLLGHVLVLVNKSKSYEGLLLLRIAKPLGLVDTRVTLSPSMTRRLAPAYGVGGQARNSWDFDVFVGAGGVRSTAHDLLRFASHNLRPEKSKLGKIIRLTHEKHYKPSFLAGIVHETPMGLGWHFGRMKGTIYHTGATGGYRSYLAIHQAKKLVVAILANTNSAKITALGDQVLVVSMGGKARPLQVRKAITVGPRILARYVGEYRLSPSLKFSITLEGTNLCARLTGQSNMRIFPATTKRFFYRNLRAEITFELDKKGKVEALVLHQNGRHQVAKKIE